MRIFRIIAFILGVILCIPAVWADNGPEVLADYIEELQYLYNDEKQGSDSPEANFTAQVAIEFLATGQTDSGKNYGVTAARPWQQGEYENYITLIELAAVTSAPVDFAIIYSKVTPQWRQHAEVVERIYNDRRVKLNFKLTGIFPGDGFYVRNPDNPQQQILFIASRHDFRPRHVRNPAVINAIKNFDILVTESLTPNDHELLRTWDEGKIIANTFIIWQSHARNLGYIKEHGFKINDDVWYLSLNPEDLGFLKNHLEAILVQRNLYFDHIHPAYLAEIIDDTRKDIENRIGLDSQLRRFFYNSNKPIYTLEEWRPSAIGVLENLFSAPNNLKSDPTDQDVAKVSAAIAAFKAAIAITPKQYTQKSYYAGWTPERYLKNSLERIEEKDSTLAKRNIEWIKQLLQHVNTPVPKSIGISVGLNHYPGQKGLIRLLEQRRFQWRRFEDGPFTE